MKKSENLNFQAWSLRTDIARPFLCRFAKIYAFSLVEVPFLWIFYLFKQKIGFFCFKFIYLFLFLKELKRRKEEAEMEEEKERNRSVIATPGHSSVDRKKTPSHRFGI